MACCFHGGLLCERLRGAQKHLPAAEKRQAQETNDRDEQKKLVSLDVAMLHRFLHIAGRNPAQMIAVQVAQLDIGQAHGNISAAGLFGQLPHEFVVELGKNGLSLEAKGLLPVRGRGQLGPFAAAEPNGEDRDPGLACLGGGGLRLSGQILAVRNENDRLVGPGVGFKGFHGLKNGVADIGFARGGRINAGAFQHLRKETVVGGQGAKQKRPAAKGEQPHAVSAQFPDQVEQVDFRPAQPAGMNIGGQHRSRDVQHDHEIPAALVNGFFTLAPLGSGGSDETEKQAADHQEQLPPLTGRRRRWREACCHGWRHQGPGGGPADDKKVPKDPGRRSDPDQVEQPWIFELQRHDSQKPLAVSVPTLRQSFVPATHSPSPPVPGVPGRG